MIRRQLAEQVVVITGASSGIGRETALRFAEHGARIVLAARGRDALDETAAEVERRGGTPYVVPADVAEWSEVEHLAECAVARFGHIDTWINNAAVSTFASFADMTIEEIDRVLRVDLFGAIYGTRAALRYMQHGTIVIVGSGLGERAVPLLSMYCTAKHGLVGFVDSVRLELAREGRDVAVTLVSPSSIDTPFYEHARSKLGVEALPLRPAYDPRVVAKTILHAAMHERRKLDAGGTGVALVAAHRASARLVDRLMLGRDRIVRAMRSDRPPRARDNLFAPSPGPSRSRGNAPGRVLRRSATTWAELHPRAALAMAAALVTLVVQRFVRSAVGESRSSRLVHA